MIANGGVLQQPVKIILPGQRSGTSAERRWRRTGLRRRSVKEALFGHMKVDGLIGRNWLNGKAGDAMHAILRAAGQNPHLLLRVIADSLRLDLRVAVGWFRSLRLFPFGPTCGHEPDALRLPA